LSANAAVDMTDQRYVLSLSIVASMVLGAFLLCIGVDRDPAAEAAQRMAKSKIPAAYTPLVP
jgi:hypothetical protein